MYDKIELAKFIHKFEVDLTYRKYLTESYPDESIRLLAHDIACNSFDWIYFPKSESEKYSELAEKAYKETPDNFLCVEMVEIKNEDINNQYADLILNVSNDANLTEKYLQLMNSIRFIMYSENTTPKLS